ncbi:hypothetical protein ONZ51_g4211 [Trametes cubensis]|uniref:Uncharacterized protein n=1 Tax=Trametes cubensis TaxID=1111947 RepID=A0AAD7TWU4_9APHY|nr:hypothetical protein ONZ51_g4211 [Trametes cubensis]
MAFPPQDSLQIDGVPPPRVLPKEVQFPADTIITRPNFGQHHWADLASIQDVSEGAMAFIRCNSDVFDWWQYRKITDGQWKFVDAQLSELNGSTYISALAQEEYNVQHADSLEVDYHATRLAHLIAGEASVVRRPDEPAYDVNIVTNEKRTIRYCFTDCVLPLPRQHRIRNQHTCGAKTRRELGDIVAQDLRITLETLEERGQALHHNGKPVKFEDIVLLSVVFCSKGTIQPRLAVVCERSNEWDTIQQLYPTPPLPHDVL